MKDFSTGLFSRNALKQEVGIQFTNRINRVYNKKRYKEGDSKWHYLPGTRGGVVCFWGEKKAENLL